MISVHSILRTIPYPFSLCKFQEGKWLGSLGATRGGREHSTVATAAALLSKDSEAPRPPSPSPFLLTAIAQLGPLATGKLPRGGGGGCHCS